MLKSLKKIVRTVVEEIAPPKTIVSPVPDGYVTVKKGELIDLSSRLELEKKKSREFFDLIERVIAQRDERWEMFLTHSREHQYAQASLEETILGLRAMLSNAVKELNQYRSKAGVKTIDRPIDLLGLPIGTAEEFSRHMKELRESVSAPIDAVVERDRIVAEHVIEEERFVLRHVREM